MFRNNFVWAFIGKSGAGKTVTAKEIARAWKKARKRKGLKAIVFAFDPHDAFRGIADVKIDAKDEDWASVLLQRDKKTGEYLFTDCLVILDDYRTLLKSDKMPPDFLDLLGLRRRLNIDIIYMVHNPKLILERLSYFSTHFSIFRTEAHADDFADKIQKFLACQRGSLLVNAYANTFNEKEYNALYPNFPYVHIRSDSDQLFPVNMEEERMNALILH